MRERERDRGGKRKGGVNTVEERFPVCFQRGRQKKRSSPFMSVLSLS